VRCRRTQGSDGAAAQSVLARLLEVTRIAFEIDAKG
jgi:hypothetical protein